MRRKTKILIVDDDQTMCEVLELRLQEWEFDVRVATDGLAGRDLAETYDPDIVIADVVMPELSGMELLKSLKSGEASRPVILITAQGSVDTAVDAMKHGAQDFLTKPIDYPKLRAMLEATEQDIRLRRKSRRLSSRLEKESVFGEIVGRSRGMREVFELIEKLSASDAAVIITGESGTGKELVARSIHKLSRRSEGPFLAVNASAIPESLIESEIFGHEKGAFTGAVNNRPGCFELADKGSLFLDEIAEMPMQLQPKLLRVLEDRKVRRLGGKEEFSFDVRLITATNQDPSTAVREGTLREDLYYRLNVFTIHLPPLRERKDDIPFLAQYFIQEFNRKHNASVDAIRDEPLKLLKTYTWPGNVRELRNVMERAVILSRGQWIEDSHLPPYIRDRNGTSNEKIVLPVGVSMADAEKELILRTLQQTGNNKAEAARQLNVDVKTIRNKLKAYKIEED